MPAGAAHTMWNASSRPTRTRWRTTPAGRTSEWFAAIGAGGGAPEVAPAAREFRDVVRPVGLTAVALPVLALVGRIRARSGVTAD